MAAHRGSGTRGLCFASDGVIGMLRDSRHVVLPALLVLFVALLARPQDLPRAEDPNKTYELTGTVINYVTGKPIPRALVRLTGLNRRRSRAEFGLVGAGTSATQAMLTDQQGEFSFNNLSPGTALIQVRKPGYFRPGQAVGYPSNSDSIPYKVQVGPDGTRAILKLSPAAVVTGTILGNDEEPLEGVDVALLHSQVSNGKRQLVRIHGAASDEDGHFRIGGLIPGHYFLSVHPQSSLRRMLGREIGNPTEIYPAITYFPESSDPAGATALELTPGQHFEANFSLKKVSAFKVAGVIVNSGEWKRINYVSLVDQLQQPVLFPDRFDPASGAFEFRAVPAGTYFLQGTAETREGQAVSNYRALAVQSNLIGLRIPIQASDIPIVVHKDFVHANTGRAQCTSSSGGDVHVSDCSDYPAARLELYSLDFPQQQFQSDGGPLKGIFTLHGVAPGRYSVRATASFGGYVQSMRCSGLDLLREPLVVPEDGSVNPIEVVLRDDFASLSIKVHTDKPDQQPQVLVFADSAAFTESFLLSSSRGSGVYFNTLAPGAYKVFAFDDAQDFDPSNLEELEKYAAQAASVTVGANENASIMVDLIHVSE